MKRSVTIIEGIPKGTKEGREIRILDEFFNKMIEFKSKCKLRQCETKSDFVKALRESDSRFLHISAHSNGERLVIGRKEIFVEAADLKVCKLKNRFLTISACGHISTKFVQQLHSETKVTAVILPMATVGFAESALFTSIFYFTLARARGLSQLSEVADSDETDTSFRLAQYIDAFQRAKIAYLGTGGNGAHRLFYWYERNLNTVT